MEQKELDKILEKHLKWLRDEKGGERYVCGFGANLTGANLIYADLTDANLTGANLTRANLTRANLTRANLTDANLTRANLTDAVLNGSKGLMTAKNYLSQFKMDKKGIVVFKAFGNTYYSSPVYWDIKPNSFLEETVNPLRTQDCGSGVNFATLEWINKNFADRNITIWKCRILWEDLADVVVPYNTDGKARCARLQLIEPLKEK
jgi:hypothetical protein